MIVLIQAVSIYYWFLSNAFCCSLLGFRIETTHMAKMRRKYTVWGMSNQSAEKLQFEIIDEASKRATKTTVAGYFLDTYGIELRYVYICCFRVEIRRAFKRPNNGRKASAPLFDGRIMFSLKITGVITKRFFNKSMLTQLKGAFD